MYKKTLIVAFFIVIATSGILITAASIAASAQAQLTCAGREQDTRACPSRNEIRSSGECDIKGRVGCSPPQK